MQDPNSRWPTWIRVCINQILRQVYPHKAPLAQQPKHQAPAPWPTECSVGEVQLPCLPFPAAPLRRDMEGPEACWQPWGWASESDGEHQAEEVSWEKPGAQRSTQAHLGWSEGGELKRDNNFVRKEVKLLLKDIPWSFFLVPCQFIYLILVSFS